MGWSRQDRTDEEVMENDFYRPRWSPTRGATVAKTTVFVGASFGERVMENNFYRPRWSPTRGATAAKTMVFVGASFGEGDELDM
jgi:beta-N-acetylglucosaminidase